jgi:hypothetical protein
MGEAAGIAAELDLKEQVSAVVGERNGRGEALQSRQKSILF